VKRRVLISWGTYSLNNEKIKREVVDVDTTPHCSTTTIVFIGLE
jgi:hypothetical protein